MGAHLTVRFTAPHANHCYLGSPQASAGRNSTPLFSAFLSVSLRSDFSTAAKFPSEFLNST